MLAPHERAQIRQRIDELAKLIRRKPHVDMSGIVKELRAIKRLNTVKHFRGPVALFARCDTWLRRAQRAQRAQARKGAHR
jgi:hypothetical protein